MLERGLLPDFSAVALAELNRINSPVLKDGADLRNLGSLVWCSIDNDDSMDLDQVTMAAPLADDQIKVLVAIADVDSLVKLGSAIDEHARQNTTSVYTSAEIFSMLPEKLSTDFTSLAFNEDRSAIVIELTIASDGSVIHSDVYPAVVRNHAKLAYNSVAAWLEGTGPEPEGIPAVPGLAENLKLQDRAAQQLKNFRHLAGALSLETIESKAQFNGDVVSNLEVESQNRATEIIEDFMIAANQVTARFLTAHNLPSIRRVVRDPRQWDGLIKLAAEYSFALPSAPDPKPLNEFLMKQKAADPLRFPDLSLAVIKLLGRGEYMAEIPGQAMPGHFGLAVSDYNHSTAPNRRYSDLITQRLLKAALAGTPSPYTYATLTALALQCTDKEDDANQVERKVGDCAAALLLQPRIGNQFDALVTDTSPKGTWVRLLELPVEGMLMQPGAGLSRGKQIRVQLVSVNVELGFIDFKKVG